MLLEHENVFVGSFMWDWKSAIVIRKRCNNDTGIAREKLRTARDPEEYEYVERSDGRQAGKEVSRRNEQRTWQVSCITLQLNCLKTTKID